MLSDGSRSKNRNRRVKAHSLETSGETYANNPAPLGTHQAVVAYPPPLFLSSAHVAMGAAACPSRSIPVARTIELLEHIRCSHQHLTTLFLSAKSAFDGICDNDQSASIDPILISTYLATAREYKQFHEVIHAYNIADSKQVSPSEEIYQEAMTAAFLSQDLSFAFRIISNALHTRLLNFNMCIKFNTLALFLNRRDLIDRINSDIRAAYTSPFSPGSAATVGFFSVTMPAAAAPTTITMSLGSAAQAY